MIVSTCCDLKRYRQITAVVNVSWPVQAKYKWKNKRQLRLTFDREYLSLTYKVCAWRSMPTLQKKKIWAGLKTCPKPTKTWRHVRQLKECWKDMKHECNMNVYEADEETCHCTNQLKMKHLNPLTPINVMGDPAVVWKQTGLTWPKPCVSVYGGMRKTNTYLSLTENLNGKTLQGTCL